MLSKAAAFIKSSAELRSLAICLAIAVVVFGITLDFHVLNPAHIDWCLSWDSDLTIHFLGFAYYRHADWSFPITHFDTIYYPVGASIVTMDSLPLLAVPLKLLNSVLPEPIQYFGPWLFICIWLQVYFAQRVLRGLKVSPALSWSASALIAAAPPLVYRYGHGALSAHWLILASIGAACACLPRAFLWLLPIVAIWIHPYLLPMIVAICAVGQLRFRDASGAAVRSLAAVSGVGGSLWVLGYFHMSQTQKRGYEHYLSDVFSFVSPMGSSSLFPSPPLSAGAFEGFAYLGLGGIVLLAFLLLSFAVPGLRRKSGHDYVLLGVCVAMALFAVTAAPRFFGEQPFKIEWLSELLEPIGSRFRATGRFVWPLYYYVLIFGAKALDELLHDRRRRPIVATALVLAQAVDVGPWLVAQGRHPALAAPARLPEVPEDVRAQLKPSTDVLVFVPPVKASCGKRRWESPYLHLAMFGAHHELKTNADFGQARVSAAEQKRVCRYTLDLLRTRARHPEAIVVRP